MLFRSPSNGRKVEKEGLGHRGIFSSIPRRQRVAPETGRGGSPTLPPPRTYRPSTPRVLYRLLAWSGHLALFLLANMADLILRRGSIEKQAIRFRRTLEKMGPTAIKVGQQLSARADVIRYQYCDELSKMLDQVPPYLVKQAVQIIEKAIGERLEECWNSFPPSMLNASRMK